MVKQLSILLENIPGKLAEVSKILGENDISICAMTANEVGEFRILRLIVSDTKKAIEILGKNFTVAVNDVLVVQTENKPGNISKVAALLKDINIEYLYSVRPKDAKKAVNAFKISDMKKAEKILKKKFVVLDDSYFRR